jgi:hypothetical protein
MANSTITGLPAATVPLSGAEVLPIVQSGVTDQVSVANLTAGRTVNALNVNVSSALTVTGFTTLTGGLAGGAQSLTGPGAVNLSTLLTVFTATTIGNALTLADGTVGQLKTIVMVAESLGTDTGILVPTTRVGYSTITLNNIGDAATLQYLPTGWAVLSVRGAVVA